MHKVSLIYVPYDSGIRDLRMGAGPLHIRDGGVADRLRRLGTEVTEASIQLDEPFHPEITAAFELHRRVGTVVAQALRENAFPWVIAGNCNTAAIGAAAGVGSTKTALLWFDAHDDFETPETSTTGFFDGMGLATLTGQCWTSMLRSTGVTPLTGDRVLLIGARDVSQAAAANLAKAGVTQCSVAAIRGSAESAITPWLHRVARQGVERLIVHIDLDVHDPNAVAPANGFAVRGGLSAGEVREVMRMAHNAIPAIAATLASFDPAFDQDGRMLATALEMIASFPATDILRPNTSR
jgi:arginase